jgi:hypothetical protein
MLYRYFIGTGETNIENAEQIYHLFKKGMINGTSQLYDVKNNVYIAANEIPEFREVFQGNYVKEKKSVIFQRYIVSFVIFLIVLLMNMLNTFLHLGIDEMNNNTTYFLVCMLGTFIGTVVLIALASFACIKAKKKHHSKLILGTSIFFLIISLIIYFIIFLGEVR